MSLFALKLGLLLVMPFIIYFLYIKFSAWKLKKQWEKSDSILFTEENKKILIKKFHPYRFLSTDEQNELERKIKFFLSTKNINGVGDLVVTDEMKLLVAAGACLLVTNISSKVFPGLKNIFILEDTFVDKDNPVNPHTGLQMDVPKLGQAFKRGPIVLSWNAITSDLTFPHRGGNVIYHEFSHNLDQQDGVFDGTPPLGPKGNYQRWSKVMEKEFVSLRKSLASFSKSDIDFYGATNEAEFFAVITEYYFTRPKALKDKHLAIYDIFDSYFKMNPLRWDS